jgi:hypothetical protein
MIKFIFSCYIFFVNFLQVWSFPEEKCGFKMSVQNAVQNEVFSLSQQICGIFLFRNSYVQIINDVLLTKK